MKCFFFLLFLLSSNILLASEGINLRDSDGKNLGTINCLDYGSDLNSYLSTLLKNKLVESVTINKSLISIKLIKLNEGKIELKPKRIIFDEKSSIIEVERANFDEECSFISGN